VISTEQKVHIYYHAMTSTTATNIPPPLEAMPSPYHSYWGNQGEETPEAEEGTNEDSPNQQRDSTSIDDDELKNYECAVCFEIMSTPVGCGSCETRFCRPCLERVAKQGGTRPKCSHCRAPFTLESIQVDEALQEEMKNSLETVLCPFRGCGKTIPINAIKLHEEQCDHMKMKCKFSEWGCEWIGKKKDLEHHDNHECEFRNEMGRLVNAVREKVLNQAQAIARLRDTGVYQAVNRNTRHMLMVRGRNAGNIFDVLALSYEAICFPDRLAASKEMWGDMVNPYQHIRSYAMVFNVLLVFPLILCMAKFPFWMAIDLANMTPRRMHKLGITGLWEEFHMTLMVIPLTLFTVSGMIIDTTSNGGNSTQWFKVPLPGTNKRYPLIRDCIAIFVFVLYNAFVDFMYFWPGIALLLCTFSFTVFFSSCVATILEKVNGSESDTLKKCCKMWSVMVFALRYLCLYKLCYVHQILKGVVVLRLARHATSKHFKNFNFTLEETECFFSAIPPSIYVAIGVAMTAMDIKNGVVKDWMTAVNAWLVGPCFVACFNLLTYVFYWFGQASGDSIYEEGKRNERIQSNNLLPSRRPVFTGVVITFLALFYVVFIVCV